MIGNGHQPTQFRQAFSGNEDASRESKRDCLHANGNSNGRRNETPNAKFQSRENLAQVMIVGQDDNRKTGKPGDERLDAVLDLGFGTIVAADVDQYAAGCLCIFGYPGFNGIEKHDRHVDSMRYQALG